jgi:hypothetical protein
VLEEIGDPLAVIPKDYPSKIGARAETKVNSRKDHDTKANFVDQFMAEMFFIPIGRFDEVLRTVLPDYRNMVPQLTISISYETLQADSVTSPFIFLFQGFGIRKGPLSDRARMRNHRNRSAR